MKNLLKIRWTKVAGCSLLLLSCLCFLAFRNLVWSPEDLFAKLGVTPEEARNDIFFNVVNRTLQFPHSSSYALIRPESRTGLVLEMGAFIKKQVTSPEFKEQYRELREDLKPKMIDHTSETDQRIREIKEQLSQYEEGLRTASSDLKPVFEEGIAMAKSQLKILEDPSHPDHALYTGQHPEILKAERAQYQQDLQEFETKYPEDLEVLVKERLQQFLELTADIDWNAELVAEGGKKVFKDPLLESKDHYWKLCFRAGKETIIPAREYATKWLEEM